MIMVCSLGASVRLFYWFDVLATGLNKFVQIQLSLAMKSMVPALLCSLSWTS